MTKIKQFILDNKGVIFLISILIFFILINLLPFLFKDDTIEVVIEDEEEVFISSLLPITDVSGKELEVSNIQEGIIGYSEFSLKLDKEVKDTVKYEIYLEDVTEKDVFKYNYIKVYLTDENGTPYKQFGGNVAPSYSDMKSSLKYPSKRILLSDTISGDEIKSYKLRIWVADTYVLDNNLKEFKGKISVETIY